MFNSNQAFLLVQKLKLAPKGFTTLGVKANVELKSSIPIGAKVEIGPQGLYYTRSQG
jgi:predicted thioesterase